MKRLFILLFVLLPTLSLAGRHVTLSDIDGGKLRAKRIVGLRSMADGEHYTAQRGENIVRYSYSSGEAVDTLFYADRCAPKINPLGYEFSQDENLIIFPTDIEPIYRHSFLANYWLYDRIEARLYPLSTGGKQQQATISPDGRKVAFVRDNNLWVADLISKSEKQVTFDGLSGEVINGVPDWVYEEEYGFARAFEWSPASDAIAYYRFDERRVKSYPMNTFRGGLYPEVYNFKYPKAGEDNSIVQIKVYRVNTGATTVVDIGFNDDIYIPRIEWTGRGTELAVHRLNRLQNRYDLLLCDAILGISRVSYSESSPRYVERIDEQKIMVLPNGKHFVVKSEVDGWMHLYLYELTTGKKVCQITKGEWEVTAINGYDARSKRLFYTSTEGSALERSFYSIGLDGRGKRQLSGAAGYYDISMSHGAKYYISHYSTACVPTVATLHQATGKQIRVLEDNAQLVDSLALYEMPVKEFFEFTTPNGNVLEGYILKPADFDSTRLYPVLMTQYSGPGSQSVDNKWGLTWEASLLGEGYLVACVDGRGTGFRGEQFKKCTYGNLGGLETEDQIFAAHYLGDLPYVDPSRIGIYGWSYGGFMALNCILKGSDVFKMAIAIAPVTSWRYYDTIYTELYNGLPSDNPKGYDDNSPLHFASLLRGKLFMAHGTADDNVHVQNSYDMISALLKAGKSFDWVIYPDVNHGMGSYRSDLTRRMIEYVKCNL